MKLSIITINRNNAEGLRKTIESVVSQTYTDFEYIIIDGASTDESVEVIKEYADKIDYWVSEPDKGIYNAMNKGILKAQGEYLLFLNSGDYLYCNNTLQNVFRINYKEQFIYGDVILRMSNNSEVKTNFPQELSLSFFFEDMLCHQGVFFKKDLFTDKLYSEDYKIAADFDFILSSIVIENKSYRKVSDIISYYDNTGYSSNPENDEIHLLERSKILQSYFNENVLNDIRKYNKLKFQCSKTIYNYVQYIIKYEKLHKLSRKLLKVLIIMHKKMN